MDEPVSREYRQGWNAAIRTALQATEGMTLYYGHEVRCAVAGLIRYQPTPSEAFVDQEIG